MTLRRPTAFVLHDTISAESRPDEADVLVQAEQVSTALEELGWRTDVLAVDIDLAATRTAILGLRDELRPGLVVNLVESLSGDGRLIHPPSRQPSARQALTASASMSRLSLPALSSL